MKGNSNRPNGGNGRLLYIVGMDGNLVVGLHQVDFGENGTTEKLVDVIVDMADGKCTRV
jgi:hypothetical protein